MHSRRLATLSVSILAALAFGAAACNATGPGGSTASPSPSATATTPEKDAREALAEGVSQLSKTSYKTTLTAGPASGSGTMDPVGQQGQMTMSLFAGSTTLKIDTMLLGPDMWIKLTGVPGVPNKWLHLDASRLPEGTALGVRPGELDPAGANRLVSAITSVERVGDRQFKGTLDLTKANNSAAVNKSTVEALGERAKAVPFEATTDAEGRLTNFTMDLGQVQGVQVKVDASYTDFGTKVTVTKPAAADVVEAPPAVYDLLGG